MKRFILLAIVLVLAACASRPCQKGLLVITGDRGEVLAEMCKP